MIRNYFGLASYLLLCLAMNAWSQETTGNLEGWLFNAQGEPISDVNVTVNSHSLQGRRGSASENSGFFRIKALPIGGYTVQMSHIAYQNVVYEKVTIALGKTTTLGKILLNARTLETSEVIIRADRPNIDPVTTTIGLNLNSETIELLPIDRNYRSIVALSPQANASFHGDEVNISGSTGMENVYYIDGVNVTDSYNLEINTNLPYNFIDEIEVKTGGYEAEHGSALGGVVNVITRSGGNKFRANAFAYFTNNGLTGTEKSGLVGSNVESFLFYDLGFSAGGPLIRDKLWFYTAYNPNYEVRDIAIPGFRVLRDKKISHVFAGKLTWRVSEKANVVFTAFGDPSTHHQVQQELFGLGAPQVVENADVLLINSQRGGLNLSLKSRFSPGQDFLLETTVSRVRQRDKLSGETERGRTEPFMIDLLTGTWSGGVGRTGDNSSTRTSAAIKASWFLGHHTLKLGFEYEDNLADINFSSVSTGLALRFSDTNYSVFSARNKSKVRNRSPAAFLQDSWQLNPRLRVNGGLRWDGQYLIGSDGGVAQSITDQFQPRAGFVFQPGELGTQKIFASFGRFYEKIPTRVSESYHSIRESFIVSFDHNPIENSAGGDTLNNSRPILPEVEGLEGQYIDEFTLGYEREVGGEFKFGVRGGLTMSSKKNRSLF